MGTTVPLLLQCITIRTWLLISLGDRALSSFVVLQASFHSQSTLADFVHPDRLHTITVAGKSLINLFYDKAYTKSYFLGCSLGGRQGIKAAEMFPGDFDGIVAGSPALDFNNLQSWRARFFTITGRVGSSDFISRELWTGLIHDEVLNQCDDLDGAMDGIIEDPNLCSFRPEVLLCTKNKTGSCLTSSQAAMVRDIFSPFYGEDGKLVYPGMQPGSEILAATNLYAGKPFSYSEVTNSSKEIYAHSLMFPLLELVQVCCKRSIMGCSYFQHSRCHCRPGAEPFKYPNLAPEPVSFPKARRKDDNLSRRSG